jgi:SAM-dependent methyltransferase
MPSFEDLLAEGSKVPVEGWDFSWFEGRATEERPPWGYARLLAARMAELANVQGAAALDLQTGGGEVLATVPKGPPTLIATESWPPNITVARRNLAKLGVRVVETDNESDDLPFNDAAFDLVVSRHPVHVRWDEVARVLKPGGTYLSQGVSHGSVGELADFLMGSRPKPEPSAENPRSSVINAEAAGLRVIDIREFHGKMEFYDIAAVVYFLRKVIWTVPGFTPEAYRDRLRLLHDQIETQGPFIATSMRFLIEARRPSPNDS